MRTENHDLLRNKKMLDFGYYNMDCMQGMKEFPDKYFDLAIVDPPYGTGGGAVITPTLDCAVDLTNNGTVKNEDALEGCLTSIISVTRTGGTWAKKYSVTGGIPSDSDIRHWDVSPTKEYFDELARVSKNQIIWGGNYFGLPPTRCFLIWEKLTISENFSMAMAEYAWTSFNGNAKIFKCAPQGKASEPRFHPTQKPVVLYEWILSRYAKDGDIILDTHVGSASSLIACYNTNHKYVGFELDKHYYELSKKRLEQETAQLRLFDFIQ